MVYQFTVEDRKRGGQVRAGRVPSKHDTAPTAVEARKAAHTAHNQQIAPKGAAALFATGQWPAVVAKIAAHQRLHPTSAERRVIAVLTAAGLVEDRDYYRAVHLHLPGREVILDFVLHGPLGNVAVEPGHRLFHGDAQTSIDGQDYTKRDQERVAAIQAQHDLAVIPVDATLDAAVFRAIILDACRLAGLLPEA